MLTRVSAPVGTVAVGATAAPVAEAVYGVGECRFGG